MNINIEQVANGFVVRTYGGPMSAQATHVFVTLDSLFEHIRSIQTLEVESVASKAYIPKNCKPPKTATEDQILSSTGFPITYGHPEN